MTSPFKIRWQQPSTPSPVKKHTGRFRASTPADYASTPSYGNLSLPAQNLASPSPAPPSATYSYLPPSHPFVYSAGIPPHVSHPASSPQAPGLSPLGWTGHHNTENQPPQEVRSGLSAGAHTCKRSYHKEEDKLSMILKYMRDELHWTLGHFLYRVFEFGRDVHREDDHAQMVQRFLKGTTSVTPAMIIHLWEKHPDGRNPSDSEHMYSLDVPYREAQSVRVALTSFAVQTVRKKLVQEAEQAVKPESGLHASRKRKRGDTDDTRRTVEWADIGSAALQRTAQVIEEHQPTTQGLLLAVAERPRKKAKTDPASSSRKHRPAAVVAQNIISTLNFSRSNRANLLPLARGILYFALSAPFDLYHYNSRIGTMPSYSTVYKTLEELAQHEAAVVLARGQDSTLVDFRVVDNVQYYMMQRDARIGRENYINIGIAATYIESPHFPISALDLDDKRRRLAANERSSLTVEKLLGFIDMEHRELVGVLHWMRIITDHIPELEGLKDDVSYAFRTRAKKQVLPATPSKVHPLATSGKNETVTTELKDGLVDFMEQSGQRHDSYLRRLILIGGDGLTYEKMVLIKHYLQRHPDPFQSFELIQPVLAPWHTGWADICRIFSAYYGSPLSKDPSTLGYGAAKIGRRPPSNLKKPDFKEASDMTFLTMDAQVVNCFRTYYRTDDIFAYFESLASAKKLPTFTQLERVTRKLFRAYSGPRAFERALHCAGEATPDDHPNVSEWKQVVPLGTPWVPINTHSSSSRTKGSPSTAPETAPGAGGSSSVQPPTTSVDAENSPALAGHSSPANKASPPPSGASPCASSSGNAAQEQLENTSSESGKKRRRKKKTEAPKEPFTGDRVLANSIAFLSDAWVCREFLYAVTEGDVGRVYEAMKMMIFTFAGSPHCRYTSYVLEFVVTLELESSAELRETILGNLLVNLSGKPGRFSPVDLIQEYFNRLLQAIAERKGADYNAHFIRNVVSRNLHHLARLLNDMKESVGLMARPGRHAKPHTRPEFRTLLREYKAHELHHRRPGRTYTPDSEENERPMDHIRGVASLRNGKLAKWVKETVYMRSVRTEMLAELPVEHPERVSQTHSHPGDSSPSPLGDLFASDSDSEDDDCEDEDIQVVMDGSNTQPGESLPGRRPMSMPYFHDGSLVIDEVDITMDAQRIVDELDRRENSLEISDSESSADELGEAEQSDIE